MFISKFALLFLFIQLCMSIVLILVKICFLRSRQKL